MFVFLLSIWTCVGYGLSSPMLWSLRLRCFVQRMSYSARALPLLIIHVLVALFGQFIAQVFPGHNSVKTHGALCANTLRNNLCTPSIQLVFVSSADRSANRAQNPTAHPRVCGFANIVAYTPLDTFWMQPQNMCVHHIQLNNICWFRSTYTYTYFFIAATPKIQTRKVLQTKALIMLLLLAFT